MFFSPSTALPPVKSFSDMLTASAGLHLLTATSSETPFGGVALGELLYRNITIQWSISNFRPATAAQCSANCVMQPTRSCPDRGLAAQQAVPSRAALR